MALPGQAKLNVLKPVEFRFIGATCEPCLMLPVARKNTVEPSHPVHFLAGGRIA